MNASGRNILSSFLALLVTFVLAGAAQSFDGAAGPGYDSAPGMTAAAWQGTPAAENSPVKDGMFKIPNFVGDSRLDNHYGWSDDCKCYKKQRPGMPSQAPAKAGSGGFTAPGLAPGMSSMPANQPGYPIGQGRAAGFQTTGGSSYGMNSSAGSMSVPGLGGPASATPQWSGQRGMQPTAGRMGAFTPGMSGQTRTFHANGQQSGAF